MTAPMLAPNSDYVRDIFGDGGLLAQSKPNYEARSEQVNMVRRVDQALRTSSKTVIEAPTGLGKSIAYLVPATKWASETGKRVVVCTANIALQEQLIDHDLPFLQKVLPWSVTFGLAKGRGNYICDSELDEARKRGDANLRRLERTLAWLEDTRTGDLSELSTHVDEEELRVAQRLLTISSSECLGQSCSYYQKTYESEPWCWANQAKAKLEHVGVIVANYHMLFTDIRVRELSDGYAGVLPPYHAVIWDECHRAADIARDFFGERFTVGTARSTLKHLPKEERLKYEPIIQGFAKFCEEHAGQQIRDAIEDPRVTGLVSAIEAVSERYMKLAAELSMSSREHEIRRGKKMVNWSDMALRNSIKLDCLASAASPHSVYMIDKEPPALLSKLVEVAQKLESSLWSKTPAAILTSATVAVDGKFKHVTDELGIKDADSVALPSPFNYRRNCRLVVPSSMPDPAEERERWEAAALTHILRTVEMARGRTLVLCTSNKMLTAVYEYLSTRSEYTILRQQSRHQRSAVVQHFRTETSSVLVGTESFWAGVDIPGESLSCVVIDKLPFPAKDDPVVEALRRKYDDPFRAFSKVVVPRAVLQLKQGFGRLIRNMNDRGVVVCLDRRILTKRFGTAFIRSLPDVKISEDLKTVEEFFS